VLEVALIHHGRLINVVVRCDSVIVRDLGELFHILHVVAADVDVKEDAVSVVVLLFHQVVEVRTHRRKSFRQTQFFIHRVHREIKGGHSGVSQPVCYLRP
jgi:hypothetical protein